MPKIIYLDKVDSTNNYAQEHFESLPDRSLIVSKTQTKGKGRRGKSWLSPDNSGLYASYVMKNISQQHHKTSWLGGLATLYTIREITKSTIPLRQGFQRRLTGYDGQVGGQVRNPQSPFAKATEDKSAIKSLWIKWPNDIFCSSRKLAGILCEAIFKEGNKIAGSIIGIGINVNSTRETLQSLDKPATSILIETGVLVDIEAVANILLRHLNELYDIALSKGMETIYDLWKKENALIGKNVEILLDNDNILTAKVLDIEDSGKLVVVDTNANIHKIYSGDVSIKSFQTM